MKRGTKITWTDFRDGKANELMKHYGVSERGLQQQLHKHLDGANLKDKEQVYKEVYDKRK